MLLHLQQHLPSQRQCQCTRTRNHAMRITAQKARTTCKAAQEDTSADLGVVSRRQLLIPGLAAAGTIALAYPQYARADGFGFGAVRKLLRPDDVTPEQAVVVLLDARSVLREIAALAATPQDSQERFEARKLWPGFAKRLREVGPTAPVVAGLISNSGDKEETLSEYYGGKSSEPGITDAVYLSLGNVLTISGRTIRPEAQASPGPAQEAEAAIQAFLDKVPADLLAQAQEFRVKRAAQVASKAA